MHVLAERKGKRDFWQACDNHMDDYAMLEEIIVDCLIWCPTRSLHLLLQTKSRNGLVKRRTC